MRTAAVVVFCIAAAFVVADVRAASTAKPGATAAVASTPAKSTAAVSTPGKAASAAAGTLSTPLAKPASVSTDPKATTSSGEACPTQCPYSYQPLCGKSPVTGNTRTFSNECDLKKYNCTYPNKYEFSKAGKC